MRSISSKFAVIVGAFALAFSAFLFFHTWSDAVLGKQAATQIIAVGLGIALLFAAIIVVFRLVVGRRLARITAHFQRAAGAQEIAQIAPIEVQGKDEIGMLAEGYNALVGRLRAFHESLERRVQQRTAELEAEILRRRASETRFREFAEMLPQTVCEVDLTGRITFVNRNALEMFGYTDEDFRGGIDYRQTIVAEDRPRAEENVRRSLCGEGRGHNEYTAQRKDGTTFPAIIYSLPILHGGGPVGLRTMVVDISDRKRAEEELQQHARALEAVNRELARAKQAAEAATRAKSEFLANMSHEIRTPMTAILGFAELLREKIEEPDCVTAVDTIQRNGEYLLGVINDILDLSKIEAGELEIERVVCSPVEIVNDVASLLAVSAAKKGLTLEVQTEEPVPQSIVSDPLRLRQILMNLVGNAVKFTERGGIRVSVRMDEANGERPKLRVDVGDTGIGMDEDQLQRIFQPFVQGDTSASRRFGGTGLGLTISKRLARLLGGDLAVTSRPGHGSTFRLTVAAERLERIATFEPGSDAATTEPSTPTRPNAAEKTLACRVLLAEDGLDNQRLIRVILQRAGADVELARHGAEACEKAIEAESSGRPFDVVLMDMQMPVMDGYEATRRLREAGYGRPIIALTAHAMAGDRQRSLKAGCDDYTAKPIDRQRLVALIAQYSGAAASPGVSPLVEAESTAS